jgi:DHA1 family multidrug resistance protein-like MFS transporter
MSRWKINLYTLWITQIISLTSFGLGLPFMPYFIQELGVTDPSQIKFYTGLLTAAPALTMAVMSPIWGMVADRFGRKLMILRAMFAAVFVIGGMGLAQNVWHILFLRIMQGVFTGTITASSAFVASNTPDEKMSFSLGLMASSTFIGQSIGPLVGGHFAELFGYRISFYVGALLMLAGGLLVKFLVQEDPETYGMALFEGKAKRSVKDIFTPLIIVMLITMFLQRIVRSIFSPFMPLYIQESIASVKGAAALTGQISGFTGFMTALAGITISQIGDKKDKFKLVVGLTVIGLVLSIAVQYASGLFWFGLIYGIMFFFLGGVDPIMTSLTAQNTPPERRGVLFGFQGFVSSMGFMVSPMLGTYISIKVDNHAILWVMPILLVINLIIFLGINLYRRRNTTGEQ